MRAQSLLVVLLLAGCGARTTLSIGSDAGAGPTLRDGGARDAGARDAGTVDAARPDAGPPRTACRRDADCDGTVCRGSTADAPEDLAAIGLFCGSPESDPTGAPGSPCLEQTQCDRHLCTVSGTCVIPCVSDRDCAPDELCREAWITTSPTTMEHLSACTARVAAPSDVRVVGPEPGPMLGGVATADTLADLTPNALVVWRGPAESEPLIERIVSRTAAAPVVYDAFRVPAPDDPAPTWGVAPATIREVVTLLHPNGPRSPTSRRGFDVFLSSEMPGASERVIFQRSAEGHVLDLDLYLVGGSGWTSRDGEPPRALASAIEELRAIFAPVGVEIGDVRIHEVVGSLRRRFQMLEGSDGLLGAPPDLPNLYRLSAGANRPSVHVFFVRFIQDALGIASGIPGPHAMPGTGASGVAIASDLIPDGQLPMVIAHEIGHFCGLFHTSELDGSVNEPLTDTAECRTDRDANGDGFLLPEECVGAGGENLMFWAGTSPTISAQQGAIYRNAYFVR
ncbi:MAG: hypothetical protein R3B82_06150 [Sandaracinaceae bacterium]